MIYLHKENTVRLALFIFLLLFYSSPFAASLKENNDDKTYQVEVIVFQHTSDELVAGEQWVQTQTDLPDLKNAMIPGNLPVDSKLAPALAALEKDPRYRILAKKGWIQQAEAPDATIPVRIQSEQSELDGSVTFYVSHYLHLDVNLQFRPLMANSPPLVYKMTESRRIKSQEANYFDNPKFGLLVRVTPIKESKKGN